MNIITISILISIIVTLSTGGLTNLVFAQNPMTSSPGPMTSSPGPIGSGGAVSANAGTPGIPPGCPNPSGDNQCGEAPRQREIGQVYGSSHGFSPDAQDPNDGLSVKCYGDNTAGVATQNTQNPNPTECP